MNFPAIAKQTFDRLKNVGAFYRLTEVMMQTLSRTKDPMIRSEIVHEQVEDCLDEIFLTNSEAVKHLSCKKGCVGCCYSQVSVTEDEAELLASKLIEKNSFDLALLQQQAATQNSSDAWYAMPHYKRKCIFLNGANECSVYEDRPSVCRTNFAFSDPSDCSTTDGKIRQTRLLSTEKADMIIMGSFLSSNENGALPFMLLKALVRRKFTDTKAKLFPFRSEDV